MEYKAMTNRELQQARSSLIQIAAELLTGKWMSSYREDNPKSIPAKTLYEIEKDREHRYNISSRIKMVADSLNSNQPTGD